jgi:hypothetical protein
LLTYEKHLFKYLQQDSCFVIFYCKAPGKQKIAVRQMTQNWLRIALYIFVLNHLLLYFDDALKKIMKDGINMF